MISPPGWMFKRPGMLIPVFFLSLIHGTLNCQVTWPGAASAALGGSFVCLQGHLIAAQNQAGLGFLDHSSISVQHGRPYLLKELGVSSLSGQFRTVNGALGFALFTTGLNGFRQSSLWLSYGLRLHDDICAGLGIHIWNSSVYENLFHHTGVSFALGLQVRPGERWELGARLFHPVEWSSRSGHTGKQVLIIETGMSYCFFKVACLYSELHISPGDKLQLCGGLEWTMNSHTRLRTGINNAPVTVSWGVSISFGKWISDFSFRYKTLTGLSPYSSLSYEW